MPWPCWSGATATRLIQPIGPSRVRRAAPTSRPSSHAPIVTVVANSCVSWSSVSTRGGISGVPYRPRLGHESGPLDREHLAGVLDADHAVDHFAHRLMIAPRASGARVYWGCSPMWRARSPRDNASMTNYSPPSSGAPVSSPASGRPRLSRSRTDRMVAGVAGGLAQHLDLDVTAVRFGFVAASLLLLGGIGGPFCTWRHGPCPRRRPREAPIVSDALQAKPWESWGGTTHGATSPTP